MKCVKYLIPFLMVAGFTATSAYAQVVGQDTVFDRQLNTRDDQPLREFVQVRPENWSHLKMVYTARR